MMKALRPTLWIALIHFAQFAYASGEVPQVFTFDGRLYSDSTATTPMSDSNVTIKVQIIDPTQTCILYEETQSSINTTTSLGYFTIQVGSATGASKRTSGDSNNLMSTVYTNTGGNITGKLVSNNSACTYTPVSGDQRYVRMTVTPSGTGVANVLSPNMPLDSVPNAIVAERAENLAGLAPSALLQVNTTTASLSQSNLENIFSTSNYPTLTALIAGTSTLYSKNASNGTTPIGSVSNPTSPAAGEIWYDSGSIKYYNGSSTVTLGASTGVSSVTAGTGLNVGAGPGGSITTTGTLNVNVGTGASQIVQMTAASKLPAVDGSLLTNLNGSAITSGTIGGTTAISTSGNIQTSGSLTTGESFLYDHSGAGPGYVAFQVPANIAGSGGASYTLTWPKAVAAASNSVLTSDTSGNLSWVASSSGTVSSVTSANTDIGVANTTSTPVLTLNSGTGNNQIVKLNGSAQLPAVDGSLLTNLTPANLASAVPVNKGGTGLTSYTTGDLLYASGTTTISKLSDVATGQALISQGVGVAPIYSNAVGGVTLASGNVTAAGTSGTSSGSVQFKGYTSGGLTETVPATVTSYTITWPSAVASSANSVLSSDTSGNLSWVTLGSLGTVSLTSQVTGILPLANGGTNAALTASNGGVVYSNASQMQILSGTATAGLPLISGSSAAPSWSSVSLASGNVTLPASGNISNASGAMTVSATTGLTLQSGANNATTIGNTSGTSSTVINGGATGGKITLTPGTLGIAVTGWTTAGFVKNDTSGNLTGGNTFASSDITTALGYTPVNKVGDTMTGSLTATSFVPSSSTVPTNGLYLPAANSVGISAGSTAVATFTATGMNATVIGATTPAAATFTTIGGTSETLSSQLVAPIVYGSTAASGTVTIAGTSNATAGYALLNPSGGNVGVGTSTPSDTLQVNGTIRGPAAINNNSSTSIDWSKGNTQYTAAGCTGTQYTFSNMRDGGVYTLVITGSFSASCTFGQTSPDTLSGTPGSGSFYFLPANGTPSGSNSVYSFLRTGSSVYTTWNSGFAN